MGTGIWQLTRQSLISDARRPGLHAVRAGLGIVLYFAVCMANASPWRTAAGMSLFHSQLMITAFYLSITAIFGFSQTIVEEKEEDTLGLLRLTDVSPLAIILGKAAGLLCDALLLIAIQFPFTIVAITLGGISWPQVLAAYTTLLAYLWLLAGVGIAASVIQPTGTAAARLTCLFVIVYTLPPYAAPYFLPSLYPVYHTFSLTLRLTEIAGSSFNEPMWCRQVSTGLCGGALCLIYAWFVFDRMAFGREGPRRPPLVIRRHRPLRRAWSRPMVWREYIFLTGGARGTVFRIACQIAIVVAVTFATSGVGFACAWSAIWSGVFVLLDGTWTASRLFRDEIHDRTWSTLVQTPHRVSRLARDKVCGWALGLAPSIVAPLVYVVAMLILHEHMKGWDDRFEIVAGSLTIGLSVFGYLHLLVLLSLYLGWKGTPLTLTVSFAAGWIYVASVFTSRLGIGVRTGLFAATSLLLCLIMFAIQYLTIRRLEQLAAEA